ncbi:hypothetical protein [Alkalicoccobacillus murimartini]|uniref:Uncharacterized protein n=1 Tax=Alkalicoccobacillus murimartini TaxID=171685 RepID=A0ABT9YMG2_9BACI|nr:hypothetical protein [Alkalicoccobacillus murimartini]MDQ0208931.1 hypothetical protein [Alkalicoccobacillus murimartini]
MYDSGLSKLSFSLLISCTVLLTACSGSISSLTQGDGNEEESTEITNEGLDESTFDYEALYEEDFEVNNNFKYKTYPFLDIDKIDLDKVNDDLLAFIIADLGLESAEITHEKEDKSVATNGTTVKEDEEAEEITNDESGNSESADSESSQLEEAQDEVEVSEEESKEEESGEENGEILDGDSAEDGGWIEGKGYTWESYLGQPVSNIVIDPETRIGVPHLYNPASDDFRYYPLLGGNSECHAEYCIIPNTLPSTAFFGEDGYIYDTEYAGTWEYFDGEWIWYGWNHL